MTNRYTLLIKARVSEQIRAQAQELARARGCDVSTLVRQLIIAEAKREEKP